MLGLTFSPCPTLGQLGVFPSQWGRLCGQDQGGPEVSVAGRKHRAEIEACTWGTCSGRGSSPEVGREASRPRNPQQQGQHQMLSITYSIQAALLPAHEGHHVTHESSGQKGHGADVLAKWEFEPMSAWFKVCARLVSKKQTQGGAQGPDSFSEAQAASIAGKAPSPAAPLPPSAG